MKTMHFWYNEDGSIGTHGANDKEVIASLFDNSGCLPSLMIPVDGEYRTCQDMIDSGYELSEIREMAISSTAGLFGNGIDAA